jgi:hypothetical protein
MKIWEVTALPTWVGQRKVKSIVRSITRMSHDDLQLTRQISIGMEELDKLLIYVNSDVMILEREKVYRLSVKDFKFLSI